VQVLGTGSFCSAPDFIISLFSVDNLSARDNVIPVIRCVDAEFVAGEGRQSKWVSSKVGYSYLVWVANECVIGGVAYLRRGGGYGVLPLALESAI